MEVFFFNITFLLYYLNDFFSDYDERFGKTNSCFVQ
jgi:hypothetical protein